MHNDDRTEYDRHVAAVHAHNQRAMDEANIPHGGHSPRRGFTKATSHDLHYIVGIEQRDNRWIVRVNFSKNDSFGEHAYIIGPRGKTTKAY